MIVNKSRFAYLLGFNVLLAASSVACGGANGDDGVAPGKQESNLNTAKSCAVDGEVYRNGESFPERHGRKYGSHPGRKHRSHPGPHHGSRHGTGPGDARLPETPGSVGSTPAVPGPNGSIPCWPDIVFHDDAWPSTKTTVAVSLGKDAYGKISRTVNLGTTEVAADEDTADSEGEWYPGVDGVGESVEVPWVSIGWPGESSDGEPTPGSSTPWVEGDESYPWPGDQEATPFPYEPCPRDLHLTPDVPAIPEPFPPTSCPGTEPGPVAPPHAGSSEPPAMGCALIYAPVCGTDGSTYGNACVAEVLAQVKIAYTGVCKGR